MAFHRALVKRKYRLAVLARQRRGRPGPKGPAPELITAIVEMKRRNPRFGCRRIAQQLAFIFGVEIDKDVVRRVLARRYRPEPGSQGPSWLTFLGHSKDSLWSVDLFRCESLILRTHWVLVVMDQFTRRIVGFGVRAGAARWSRHLPHVQPCNRWRARLGRATSAAIMIRCSSSIAGKPISAFST